MRYGEFSPIYDGDEHFTNGGMPVNKLVSDFWRWNCSDLMNNSMRGSLAEFIVATALEIDTEHPRIDWNAYDLLYREGGSKRLEIKCSAYLQSWRQKADSRIVFSIAPAQAWDDELLTHSGERRRHSDIYVFCLFKHRDRFTADVTKLEQWEFYVYPTYLIDEKLGNQRTLSLGALLNLNPERTDFDNLKRVIDALCPTLPNRN